MKKELTFALLAVVMIITLASMAIAQNKSDSSDKDAAKPTHCPQFVDADGNGYNDNAPDHDGDGIPNGQDSDWKGGMHRHGNGGQGRGCSTGNAHSKGNGCHGWGHGAGHGPRFQDTNGDGVCDNIGSGAKGTLK